MNLQPGLKRNKNFVSEHYKAPIVEKEDQDDLDNRYSEQFKELGDKMVRS